MACVPKTVPNKVEIIKNLEKLQSGDAYAVALLESNADIPAGYYDVYQTPVVNRVIKLEFIVDKVKMRDDTNYRIAVNVGSENNGYLGAYVKCSSTGECEYAVTSWTKSETVIYSASKTKFKIVEGVKYSISIDSGALISYCYYYLNNGLVHTHSRQPVVLNFQNGYITKSRERQVNVSEVLRYGGDEVEDPIKLTAVMVDLSKVNLVRLYMLPYKNAVDSDTSELVKMLIAKQEKGKINSIPTDKPDDNDVLRRTTPHAEPVKSIEEIGKEIKKISDIVKIGETQPILTSEDLPKIELTNYWPPQLVTKEDCVVVNDKLTHQIRLDFGSADEKTLTLAMIGLLQAALTYSTCTKRYMPEDSNVVVKDGQREIQIDARKYFNLIETTLPRYLNPLRQYMRWWSNTTIYLIKSGKLSPNYYALARWGVTEKYIPYCFDYCILSAKYNTRDEKMAATLARRYALEWKYNTVYEKEALHNTCELGRS